MKQMKQTLFTMLGAFVFAALGFVGAWLVVPQLSGNTVATTDSIAPPQITASDLLEEQERVFNEVYNTVAPSVVAITVARQSSLGDDEEFRPASTGSGFMIDMGGHIVTNYHVIRGADRVEVALYDGTITDAEVIGEDPDSDLAVIQIDVPRDRLRPIALGDSDALNVGQVVLAVGNPFQRDWTLTSGIISGLDRSIVGLAGFSIGAVIQTDAAINPGNSGGPLVNLQGEVIGVNSQIESGTRSNSGVGFAVPSNLVAKVAQDLIENGRIEYSFIGISSVGISLDLIENFDLPNNLQGVAIRQVLPNTPASDAGLRNPNDDRIDIITAVNGEPVDDFEEMIGYLALYTEPGDTITLTVYRDGEVLELPLTLVSRSTQR